MADTLLDHPGFRLFEAPPLARLVLRGRDTMLPAAEAAYGLDLPRAINRGASKGGRGEPGARVALKLGPDEWLLIIPADEGAAMRTALDQALAGLPGACVDISARQLGYVLEGPRAAALLNTGCPLDLGEAAFPVGMATRSLFLKTEITLWRIAPELFRIEIGRSFAPYFIEMLREAAQDFA